MKLLVVFIMIASLFSGPIAAEQRASEAASKEKTPAAAREWTDHNAHDPGIAETRKSEPCKSAGARVAPSQTQPPADRDAGRMTYGDGEHASLPPAEIGDCADTVGDKGAGKNSSRGEGDPDRPIITGRASNPDEED